MNKHCVTPRKSVEFEMPKYAPKFKEKKSAPSLITAAPCVSNDYTNKRKSSKTKIELEELEEEPRVFKTGISVINDLHTKLYHFLPHEKVVKSSLSPSSITLNTLCPQRKFVNKKKQIVDSNKHLKSIIGSNDTYLAPSLLSKSSEDIELEAFASRSCGKITSLGGCKDVLGIIHYLFHRLRWPVAGILDGDVPMRKDFMRNSNETALEDDGEFVYCVPRHHNIIGARYDPYDLVKIFPKKVKNLNHYYTVSATYVSKYCSTEGTSLTNTLDWLSERKKFYLIYNIRVFKYFRLWKPFAVWKTVVRNGRTSEISKDVSQDLFQVSDIFQDSLIDIRCLCEGVSTSTNSGYISLFELELFHTYSLHNFHKAQFGKCEQAEKQLQELRKGLVFSVKEACENYYAHKRMEIERYIKCIEAEELEQMVGKRKTQKRAKNFQIIKDKYRIREMMLPKEACVILAEKKMKPFKHVKSYLFKIVHERMYRFVRLVDFIAMNMLRNIVITGVELLQKQIEASFECVLQPFLKGVSQDVDKVLGISEDKLAVPLFETTVMLQTFEDDVNQEKSKYPKYSIVLQPSGSEVVEKIKNIIGRFEAVVSSFKSLLGETCLHKFIHPPTYTFSEQETQMIDAWPNLEFLFSEDVGYQSSVKKIIEHVDSAIQSTCTYTKQFDVFCSMISSANYEEYSALLKNEWAVQQYTNVLEQFADQVSAMEHMPITQRKTIFLINTKQFKEACLPFPNDIITLVSSHLSFNANRKNESLLKILRDAEKKLGIPSSTVEEFVDHLSLLSQVVGDMPELEKEYDLVGKLFSIAIRHCSDMSGEEKALFRTLGPSFQQVKSIVMYCEAKKDEKVHKFSQDLDHIVDGFSRQLYNLSSEIRNPALLEPDSSYYILETITYLKEDLQQLIVKAKNFANYEESFSSAVSSSKKKKEQPLVSKFNPKPVSKIHDLQNDLIDVEKDLMLRQMLWRSLNEWTKLYTRWCTTPFASLDVNLLQKEVARFVQTMYLLEKGLPPNNLVQNLKQKITIFKSAMPVISSLHNPALQERHWIELNGLVDLRFKNEKTLTLGRLLELPVFEHQDRISEISSRASHEATLEQMLQKVKDYWKKTDLQLLAHASRDVAIITGVDDILAALDDSMVTIANVRGSRFHLPLQGQVNEWDRKMNLFLRTFEEWVLVQRNWLYLETVFATQDIQRQLPHEAKLFSQVDKNWRDIMRRTMDRPNALTAATTAGLIDILQGCNATLEKIHYSLEDYLDIKRLAFSRFYFLSNDELLDILSNSKNVESIQPYLSKCFASIKKLNFDMTQRAPIPINGMFSEENEYVELSKSLRARGQVEQWLSNVETSMRDIIKLHLKESIPRIFSEDFMEWVNTQYGQIALTTVQIHFTQQVELALSNAKQTSGDLQENMPLSSRNQIKGSLQKIADALRGNLDKLSSVIKTDMLLDKRNVIVSLMIIMVHERDTTDNLLQVDVETSADFQWIRQLRYHWDDQLNNCFVDQSIASFPYGYEYLGCTPRLVVTPLTNRCFLTLTGALHFHLGGAPTGPAGTGKSESVKDLAKAMGKQCIVFNCSGAIDFKVIGKLLSGIAQSGSWCCLDEFNRIDREVLSVIAQQMHVIRAAKMCMSVRFMFEGREIRLNTTCGLFITMNPGYAGRVELPDNLKSLFRPVSMVVPDNTLIAEIVLLSNGFSSASVLSQKLVNVYELSKKQLSQQNHYDFGLRAIKAVLTMAGEKNRTSESVGLDKSLERRILIKAIEDSIYPQLISDDLKLFQKLLEDVFPNYIDVATEPTKLEKSIGIALRELSLQRWPPQVEKVTQFHSILNVRHGVMLVGPTGGGKTTVRRLLRHALYLNEAAGGDTQKEILKSDVVAMVTINPKALSLGELYGEFDANTAEWTDGVLSYAVRNFISHRTEKSIENERFKGFTRVGDNTIDSTTTITNEELNTSEDEQKEESKYQWIVFDGPVDNMWVENLNTMLDDSKILCLGNGERISMLQSMKVIFEVDSLLNASPATISRCGMVYMDPVDLGWQPTVKSWLLKLRFLKLNKNDRDFLWKLFENTVDDGIAFLKEYENEQLIKVSPSSAVQTLLAFLDAFFKYIVMNGGFYAGGEAEEDADKRNEEDSKNYVDLSMLTINYNENSTNSSSKKRIPYIVHDDAQRRPFLCKLYVFAYMWAFGGHFNGIDEEPEDIDDYFHVPNFSMNECVNPRNLFDTFLRTLFKSKFDVHFPSCGHLMYSYYVDFHKGQFMLWDHLLLSTTMRAEKTFMDNSIETGVDTVFGSNNVDTSVPTPTTICYSFLISLLALHDVHVLLAGASGVGKTTLIDDVLKRLSEPDGATISANSILGSVFLADTSNRINMRDMIPRKVSSDYNEIVLTSSLAFSAHTDTMKPKQMLQSKLVKRGRNAFGTPHGERVLLFIDDLTMPQADEFGSQPALEVMRDFLNSNGFYDTKELHWKSVDNVTVIATCGNYQTVMKQNERLIQKFSTFSLRQPSAQALHHIYSTQMARVINAKDFSPEVIAVRSAIVSTVLGVYHKICIALKTTPIRCHYMFNVRDISKVICGLLQAEPTVIRTKDQFIELLINETSRVFMDRLITKEDQDVFHNILVDQIHDFLKMKWSKERLVTNNGVYGDFIELNVSQEKRTYQCLRDKNKLQQIIEEYYDRATIHGQNVPERLILFPEFCHHIVSTARVLRQPGGHLLMIGIGGTGKKAVVQLASCMEFCEFTHPRFSKNYSYGDFKEDIKKAMLRAGLKGKKVVFFINDRTIIQESFLELICTVLSGVDISTFFDGDSKKNIAFKLKADSETRAVEGSVDEVFGFFKSRVKKNLHIVMATSPSGNVFQHRCRVYPGLVNNCTVNWYSKWPPSALHTVAKKFFLTDDMTMATPSSGFLSALVFTHEYVEMLCGKFMNELQRHFHVTPKSFLDFILLFQNILNKNLEDCDFKLDRLKTGLLKLEETNQVVIEMQNDLLSLGPLLEKKKIATKELMDVIEKDQKQVSTVRAVVQKEKQITDTETKRVQASALRAQKDLEDAIPQLEAATAALNTLNKSDIGEIRSYAKPPDMVVTVLSAVCVVLLEKPDWPTAKLLLGDPGFLKKLINYNHNEVSDKVYNTLKRYTGKPGFNLVDVGRISVACKSMCAWVLAIEHYTAVTHIVRPKQEKCAQAQKALTEAQLKLAEKEVALKKVEDQLSMLEKQYMESIQQLNDIQRNKDLTLQRLQRASKMTQVLISEKDRWSESMLQLNDERDYMISESFILAASVSYMGPFPPSYRTMFYEAIVIKIKDSGTKTKETANVIESETNPILVQDWFNSGLPHDNHSVENALFMQISSCWPFIIDPQHQAFKWIKQKERGKNLKIVEANDKKLLRILESSIRLGEVVIIKNATPNLDSTLDPILKKTLTKRGNESVLILGDSAIEYNDSFRLYILTRDGNPKLLPELCIKVLVVNFIITTEGITEQILSKIVEQENPELEHQRNEILETLVLEKSRLTHLESTLLDLIHKSYGNVLDDDALIQTLFDSKNTAKEIKVRVEKSEKTETDLEKQRRTYLPLAQRGALLFFVAVDLSSVNVIYQFSLSWFLEMFCRCIIVPKNARPSSARGRLNDAKEFALSSNMERRRLSLIYSMQKLNKSSFISTMLNVVTETFYHVVSYALFTEHQLLFSFYMTTRILTNQHVADAEDLHNEDVLITSAEYEHLLQGMKTVKSESSVKTFLSQKTDLNSSEESHEDPLPQKESVFTDRQLDELKYLSNISPIFKGIQKHTYAYPRYWEDFMQCTNPLSYLQETTEENENQSFFNVKILTKFQLLLIIKTLRPDHFLDAVTSFVSNALGVQYTLPSVFDLQYFYSESNCRTPLMFILSPGADPTARLLRFVTEFRGSALHLDMISLGRSQGKKALEVITRAYTHKGSWVFLQNCHLAVSFMPKLEEILQLLGDPDTNVNPQFRLWLSSKPNNLLPVSILRASKKITVEAPAGVRSNLQNLFTSNAGFVTEQLFEDTTVNEYWKKLLYSACFFHAVLQERRKFGSFGWNAPYEFIASDLEISILTLKDMVSATRQIPWDAVQALTGEIIYGGRVTNYWDKRCLNILQKHFYNENLLHEDFSYFKSKAYKAPSKELSFSDCIEMIGELPLSDHPTIFGMHENVMYDHKKEEARKFIEQLNLMQMGNSLISISTTGNDDLVIKRAQEILERLPDSMTVAPTKIIPQNARSVSNKLSRIPSPRSPLDTRKYNVRKELSSNLQAGNQISVESIPEASVSAVATALQQERKRFDNLLQVVTSSLRSLCEALKGDILFTESLEETAKAITQNKVPKIWLVHSFRSNKSLSSWVLNLRARIEFISRWLEATNMSQPPRAIWLPGLFYPQGLLTAVLQDYARKTSMAVDSFCFQFEIKTQTWTSDEVTSDHDISPNTIAYSIGERIHNGITVFGLFLDGASWDRERQSISQGSMGRRVYPLPEINFMPTEVNSGGMTAGEKGNLLTYECPLYQTSKRQIDSTTTNIADLIMPIGLPTERPPDYWALSGVAVLCQTDD